MYIFPVPLTPRSRTLRGLHGLGETMMRVSKAWCDSMGGSFQDTGSPALGWGQQGTCYYQSQAPAPQPTQWQTASGTGTKVSVPTTTQVQVSPQISPVFVQQFQPSGSPVGAGTAMTAAPVATAADTGMQRYLEQRAELEREESARQSELMERLLMQQQPGAAAPPQMTSQFIPAGPEAEPTPSAAGGGAAPGEGAMFAAFGGAGRSMLPLLIVAGIIGVTMMGKKGKAPGRGRVKRKIRR
jgi:hypothetical protein